MTPGDLPLPSLENLTEKYTGNHGLDRAADPRLGFLAIEGIKMRDEIRAHRCWCSQELNLKLTTVAAVENNIVTVTLHDY